MMNIIQYLFVLILILQAVFGLTTDAQHCFDVLDKLPKKEIEHIYYMNFKDIAHTQPATNILSCYLRESHHGDKTLTEQYFDVYLKCDKFTGSNIEHFDYHELEELVSLGLPYDLEKYLLKILKTGNKMELEQGILYVQDVMSKDIELSRYYKEYKYYILKKYKPKIDPIHAKSKANFVDLEEAVYFIFRTIWG
ncbi:hypothetical protein FF38_06578 [Lucilia cuprina]|uniref:Uncharacterized protein n=1 Tax=Lucilia cuprina TaxID=7375 RepID=A0A0L0CB11_LUCCU|nr:hypothetical protein FF38_06578 [Lucilia cuprina]